MKNLLKTNINKLLIVFGVLFILIIISIVFIFKNSKKTLSEREELPQKNDDRSAQKNEIIVQKSIQDSVRTYILKTYPTANKIIMESEYVGAGYGIVNVNYSLNDKIDKRKIYLANYDSSWTVIHEDTVQISCTKVRELISTDTILNSFCDRNL